MNTDIRIQDDLFGHVNGAWLDTPRSRATVVDRGVRRRCGGRGAARRRPAASRPRRGDRRRRRGARKIGDMFACFVDEDRVEELGAHPARRRPGPDRRAWPTWVGSPACSATSSAPASAASFARYVDNDDRNSDRYVVNMLQGGTRCPTRRTTARSSSPRSAAVPHATSSGCSRWWTSRPGRCGGAGVRRRGEPGCRPLGQGRLPRRAQDLQPDDPGRAARRCARPSTAHGWVVALGGTPGPDGTIGELIVRQPSYLETLSQVLTETSFEDWKLWLTWKLVHSYAPYLSQAFVDENFDFYSRTLSGTAEQRDRWKRGVALVESTLAEAVGRDLRRTALPAGGQGADGRAGRQPHRGVPAEHQRAGLDERGHQGQGPARS